MKGRWLLVFLLCVGAQAQDLRISVFGLFKPRRLVVRPTPGAVLRIDGRTLGAAGSATLDAATLSVQPVLVESSSGELRLSVPGRIQREFRGKLELWESGGVLRAVIRTDLETAVASAVAAESSPGAPMEALKAQAVVSRSFYLASRRRHADFDFCDTTHCQFFRAAPGANSKFQRAVEATRGIVLIYHGSTLAAFYSANCGGHTRPSRLDGYPYFSVDCPVKGKRAGHAMGFCQNGASELARQGLSFEEILDHYFPATMLRMERIQARQPSSPPPSPALARLP